MSSSTPAVTSVAVTPTISTSCTPHASGKLHNVRHDEPHRPSRHVHLHVGRRHASDKHQLYATRKRHVESQPTRQTAPPLASRLAPGPPPALLVTAQSARQTQAATCTPSYTFCEFRLHLTTASPRPSRRDRNIRRRAACQRSPEFPHKILLQSSPSPCVLEHSREIGRGSRDQCMNSTGPRSRACDRAAGRIRC